MSYESKPPSIGLWKNDRGPVASGNSGGIRFVLWANDKRGNDKAPDYRLVLEAAQKREDAGQGQTSRNEESRSSGVYAGPSDDKIPSGVYAGPPDDGIPFAPEWR